MTLYVLPFAGAVATFLCTYVALQLRADRAALTARHRPAALATPPIVPDPEPEPEPEPEAAVFDPLTSPLAEVERFLASLDWIGDTRELETVQ